MAQTGYTPILIYSSSTAAAAPAAGNLTNSTLGSELAINITDGKLFYKDNANAVQVIGWKVVPTTAGGTGLTSYAAGDLLYYASGTTLSKLAIGAANRVLTSSGSAPQWSTGLALTSASSIEVTDNANAALRITQLGTGDALLVEDSTNPDASPFVVDASGRIIDGYTVALSKYYDFNGTTLRTPQIQLQGGSLSTAGYAQTNWAAANSPPAIYLSKSRSGTIGTQGVVLNGDYLGAIQFNGDDATNFVAGAAIFGIVDGTPGANDMPTRLVFATSADGSGAPTDRVSINSAGYLQQLTAPILPYQGAITTKNALATLSGAELVTGILNTTGTTYTITLPTGTNIEGALSWAGNNVCFDWWVINTASGTITIGANGNTTLGALTIATGTSAHFRIRRTATNTFTVYRLS